MGRYIAGVVLGYLVLLWTVILGFSMALFAPALAFEQDGSVTSFWLAYALALSFFAALLGGAVGVLIGRHRKVAKALAVLAFTFGMGGAITNALKGNPSKEEMAAMTAQERGTKARQPIWYSFAVPFIGAGGILLGGRIRNDPTPGSV